MRVGIIGLRHFHVHEMIQGLRRVPGIDLAAIAEPDEAVYATEGAKYGLTRHDDWRAMLDAERLDAVGIVNVPGERGSVVAECLNRGVSVLADKPLCLTHKELAGIREAVAGSRAVLFELLTERYNPPVATLKGMVDEGRLGRLASLTSFRPHKLMRTIRPDWFWRRGTYGGILVDLMVHDVDVFRWVTGAEALEVFGTHANITEPEHPEFEDTAHLLIHATGGVTGLFRVDWLAPAGELTHGDCRYFVVGTEGAAEVRTTGGFPGQSGGGLRLVTTTSPPVDVPLVEPEHTIYEDFAAAVRGERPSISAADLLRASELVLLGRDSADRGVPLKVS